MRNWLVVGLWVLLFQMSCNLTDGRNEEKAIPFMNEDVSWADSVLSELTVEEKLGQLLIYKGNDLSNTNKIRMYNALILGRIGGLIIEQMPLENYINFIDSCQQLSQVPLLIGSQQKDFLNNQFSDLSPLPSKEVLSYNNKEEIQGLMDKLYVNQAKALGINWSNPADPLTPSRIQQMNHNGILNFGAGLEKLAESKKSDKQIYEMIQSGLSGFHIDEKVYTENVTVPDFRMQLEHKYNFEGLLMTSWNTKEIPDMLKSGIDLFIIQTTPEQALHQLKKLLARGLLTEEALDKKIKRILLAKYWTLKFRAPLFRPPFTQKALSIQASIAPFAMNNQSERSEAKQKVINHFKAPEWELLKRKLYQQSITLASNPRALLPFKNVFDGTFNIWEYSRNPLRNFRSSFEMYADYKVYRRPGDRTGLKAFSSPVGQTNVVVIDNYIIRPKEDSLFVAALKAASAQGQLVVINFGAPQNLIQFDSSFAVVQIFERNKITETLSASLLFGGFQPEGELPISFQHLTNLPGNLTFKPSRLIHGLPQEVKINPKKLVGIDAIMNAAIDGGVFPGGQVLIAKDGKIIYNKAFGYHTYRKKQQVKETDLYDVASITKVAATTLGLMKLVDEKKISLDSRLRDVIELPKWSSLKNIPIRKLMTHQSGLQVYMPVGKYLSFRDRPNAECDSFFCKNPSEEYSIKVADNFYFQEQYIDSIWNDVNRLGTYRRKRTRYSDVNFYLLQKVVEYQFGESLDEVVANNFYEPMGLRNILFNPRKRLERDEIVPTEQDKRWRHQLLQGYVHDETSAIMGGVAGHAGLFSNAQDLAAIFQLLLNKGSYGEKDYLSSTTINTFTKKQYGSARGLGFDKPNSRNESACSREASYYTFGHTGFTGTCVWADPSHDLIYVFLSNRAHPYARNPLIIRQETRRRIHEVIYDALDTYKPKSFDKLMKELPLQATNEQMEAEKSTKSD